MTVLRRFFLLCIALLLCTANTNAQLTGTCTSPVAETYLDANNVRARILNTGGLFYRGEPHVYNVPRFSNGNSIFAAAIWIVGQVDKQLRAAATRYGPWEYWSGPLDGNGNPPTDCSEYDRVYRISRSDIENYEFGGIAAPDLLAWPTGLGAPTLGADGAAIDLMDLPLSARKDRVIDLAAGERPAIMGDQSVWWVMNDRGNVHESTDTAPLGIEVHGFAFAASSSIDAINNSTLYKYRVFNRSTDRIDSLFIGLHFDADLGDAGDDFVGSDTLRGMGFTYNADNYDGSNEGYGTPPPALGAHLLEGPLQEHDGLDNDRDGVVDEAGERLGMTSMMWYNSGGGVNEDPQTGPAYYTYLQSKWKNGRPLVFGGDGLNYPYDDPETPTNFAYPGDPATGQYWSEVNIDGAGTYNPSADRRFIVSTGPFVLEPGAETDFSFSVVWARGSDNLDSVTELKKAADIVKAEYEDGFVNFPPGLLPQEPPTLLSPANGATNQPIEVELHWSPINQDAMYHVQFITPFSIETYSTVTRTVQLDSLSVNSPFIWRVRAENVHGLGPWSEWAEFSTNDVSLSGSVEFQSFLVVRNADGPLDPPEPASAEWNGFPGNDRPTDRQQVGEGKWIIATGQYSSCSPVCGQYTSFVSHTRANGGAFLAPSDFEIRFTAEGSLHYDRFNQYSTTDRIIEGDDLPFELWNIGVATPDDPSDDFRMILAGRDEDSDGWGISNNDHDGSGDDDDPETDWIYWFNPSDKSPGKAGYDAWAADALSGGDPGGDFLGDEVLRRMAFFNWNGGSVSEHAADPLANPYNQDLPEEGTVFRLITVDTIPVPSLSAPGHEATLPPGEISFFWHTVSIDTPSLVIAKDAEFSNLVADFPGASSGLSIQMLEDGIYYWKLVSRFGTESEIWTFTVAQVVGIEGATDSELPLRFEVDDLFPNPTRHSAELRYQLPVGQRISIEVYDILGRRVRKIIDGYRNAGIHSQEVTLLGLTAGSYYVRVETGMGSRVKSLVLVR